MTARAAARDHHIIRDRGLAVEIDDDDVLGLPFVERALQERQQSLGSTLAAGYGALLPSSWGVLGSFNLARMSCAVSRLRSPVADTGLRVVRKKIQAGGAR